MNSRQQDNFMWTWSRRRAHGPGRMAGYGALIGGICGLIFYGAMFDGIMASVAGRNGLSTLLNLVDGPALMVLMFIPGLAVVGYLRGRQLFQRQERLFQHLRDQGAEVPIARPTLQLADRLPLLSVIATLVILAAFTLYLAWAHATGNL